MAAGKMYKYKRKRRGRKRRRRRYVPANVATGGTPIPTTFKTSLRYQEATQLNPGSGGACAVYTLAANGLYDPNLSGVLNHQPRGFDELMPLYNHAVVIGSKLTVQFVNKDGAGTQLIGIALRSGTSVEVDPNNYTEGSNVVFKLLSPTGGDDQKTISTTFSNKFLGISSPLSTAILRNSDSSNPTELGVFHIFGANPWGTDTGTIDVLITVEYVVVFTEPKTPLQS